MKPRTEYSLDRLTRVVRELQDWIDAHVVGGTVPAANFTWTANSCDSLSIGDICVWDSEAHNWHDLTTGRCLIRYRREVRDLGCMFEKEKAADADPALVLLKDGNVYDCNLQQLLTACECDNTHWQNKTVCRYCWARGRRFEVPKETAKV